jgi:tRNA threonylcarbamoyladenosine biosynthesis protein TsaE
VTYHTKSDADMRSLGKKLTMESEPGTVFALSGPLGAGKTTFVKGMAEALEISEPITSPTFTYISEYLGKYKLYHMDLYRISDLEELELLGVEEMFYEDCYSAVEWFEKAEEIMPDSTLIVRIVVDSPETRKIEVIPWKKS